MIFMILCGFVSSRTSCASHIFLLGFAFAQPNLRAVRQVSYWTISSVPVGVNATVANESSPDSGVRTVAFARRRNLGTDPRAQSQTTRTGKV